MQDIRQRKKSNYRLSQRKHDFSNLLNKMIVDNNEFALRESLNPLAEEHLFGLMTNDQHLSKEGLTTLIKLVEKQVLIIGFLLPKRLLLKCWELLTGNKQTNFSQNNINSAFLSKNMLANTNTFLLMIDQSEINLERRLQLSQKILVNLSFVLVTTHHVVQKRLSLWEMEEPLLDKHGSLMIIKEENSYFNDELTQKIETLFWTFDSIQINELQNRYRGLKENTLKIPQRQAYQPMNEQEEEGNGLITRLNTLAEISLKRNWKISKGLFCYPFFYLLNYWFSGQMRDSHQLIESCLTGYCKSLEEEFLKFLQNFKLPLDELKLRNSVQTQKKTLLISARKHLTMFGNIFPSQEMTAKSHENLDKFLCDKARDMYQINNSLASKMNSALLQKLYQEVINKRFEQENSTKTIEEFQHDFQKLLQIYGSQSFRVSSQLKTFNDFFMQKKYQYAESLSKELQAGKKKYYSEKEQLKDRLDIQTGALQTLQAQLQELQQKRRKIDLQNGLLKNKISQYYKKKQVQNGTQFNSTSRKKYFEISDRRTAKFQSKKEIRDKQSIKKKSKCCCCQIM